jgi:hypothetical protein
VRVDAHLAHAAETLNDQAMLPGQSDGSPPTG